MIQLQKRTLQPYGHKLGVMAYGFEFDVDGFVGDAKKLVKDLAAGKMEVGNIRTRRRSRTTFTLSMRASVVEAAMIRCMTMATATGSSTALVH